mmetsp:Transcript_2165/g.4017  ORF Transcript_2165/g.4017 Transcript_2165/m.4017 type:complete len:88 (+) Transcript_2165:1289-1552(+)
MAAMETTSALGFHTQNKSEEVKTMRGRQGTNKVVRNSDVPHPAITSGVGVMLKAVSLKYSKDDWPTYITSSCSLTFQLQAAAPTHIH